MGVASVTSGLVEAFGGGQQGWRMMALIYAVVCVWIRLIPFFTLKELPEEECDSSVRESDTEAPAKTATISFGRTIIELLQNKYFILILLLYFVGYANSGIMQSSMAYYATYSMGNAGLMGILGMCTTIPLILGLPFMPKFIDKLGTVSYTHLLYLFANGTKTLCDISQFWSGIDSFLWLIGEAVFHMLPVGICWSVTKKMGTTQML